MNDTAGDYRTEKPQTWLRPNVRLIAVCLVVPLLLLLGGTLLMVLTEAPWLWIGVGLLVLGLFFATNLLQHMRGARIACHDGELLLYLGAAEPVRLPIDIVECFFLGQASIKHASSEKKVNVAAVVIRLAESAKEWHQRHVKHQRHVNSNVARWQDGYITIGGTWCEPLTPQLMMTLNQRLSEAHRRHRQTNTVTT